MGENSKIGWTSAWARRNGDQCAAAGVPFFFEQWGAYTNGCGLGAGVELSAKEWSTPTLILDGVYFWKIGKERAGRFLHGIEHSGLPH